MKTIRLSDGTRAVIARLGQAGYAAYAVGGCVRDSLLGRTPHDWDVCTAARPESVLSLFGEENCILTGARHGTVTVRAMGELIEVTAFRIDGAYSDGRHPDSVRFVDDVRRDLARRDFTVNAMAYSEEEGLVDPFGGEADLARGVLRAAGEPRLRFGEDALRILRLFRFGARLGFEIEEDTLAAALDLSESLARVSVERVYAEISRLLDVPRPGAYLPEAVARVCLPEALAGGSAAYVARLAAADAAPASRTVRFAALLAGAGERGARAALMRLRAPLEETRKVCLLVAWRTLAPRAEGLELRVQARRCLGGMAIEDLEHLAALRRAEMAAGIWHGDGLEALLETARRFDRAGECVRVGQLAVRGSDVAAAGAKGPAIGETLRALLEDVIAERTPNEREALLLRAKALQLRPQR